MAGLAIRIVASDRWMALQAEYPGVVTISIIATAQSGFGPLDVQSYGACAHRFIRAPPGLMSGRVLAPNDSRRTRRDRRRYRSDSRAQSRLRCFQFRLVVRTTSGRSRRSRREASAAHLRHLPLFVLRRERWPCTQGPGGTNERSPRAAASRRSSLRPSWRRPMLTGLCIIRIHCPESCTGRRPGRAQPALNPAKGTRDLSDRQACAGAPRELGEGRHRAVAIARASASSNRRGATDSAVSSAVDSKCSDAGISTSGSNAHTTFSVEP